MLTAEDQCREEASMYVKGNGWFCEKHAHEIEESVRP
jgi:hypothetical protein